MIEIHIHEIDRIFEISKMKRNFSLYYIYLILYFLFLFSLNLFSFWEKEIMHWNFSVESYLFLLIYLFIFLVRSIALHEVT